MNLRKRRRRRFVLLCLAVVLVGLVLLIKYRYTPVVVSMALTQVDNSTSTLINDAIDNQIAAGNIQYERLITLDKNLDGQITALRTDMSEVNRLKTEILDIINEQITDMSKQYIGIPLGSVILPNLFSGHGPEIPVRLLTVKTAGAEFHNDFSQAGINQTLHQIALCVEVTVTVLTPGGTYDVEVTSEVVVAQTIIVGQVPETVISVARGME